jgi:hypothetical protein
VLAAMRPAFVFGEWGGRFGSAAHLMAEGHDRERQGGRSQDQRSLGSNSQRPGRPLRVGSFDLSASYAPSDLDFCHL